MAKALKSKSKDHKKLLISLNWVGLGGTAFYVIALLVGQLIMDRFWYSKRI